jgi:hypothetical protein
MTDPDHTADKYINHASFRLSTGRTGEAAEAQAHSALAIAIGLQDVVGELRRVGDALGSIVSHLDLGTVVDLGSVNSYLDYIGSQLYTIASKH